VGAAAFVRLRAEEDAGLAAPLDAVAADQVVGVAVADRDPERAAVEDRVLFREAVLDAPTEEDPDAVSCQVVAADWRARSSVPWRSPSRVPTVRVRVCRIAIEFFLCARVRTADWAWAVDRRRVRVRRKEFLLRDAERAAYPSACRWRRMDET
jgi:hypothetical protein